MPTYEYRCPNGHDFERFAKISESQSALPCPQCGAQAERRISGGAGLVFKGSGFYITDYGKDGKKDQKPAVAAKSGEGAAASGKGGDAKGAEAKSESKSGASESAAPAKPAASSSGGSASPKSGGDA